MSKRDRQNGISSVQHGFQEDEEQEDTNQENQDGIDVYDLEPAEYRFKIRDNRSGEVKDYVMREMNGTSRDSFMNQMNQQIRFDQNGKIKGINFDKHQAYLLGRCIFDEEEKPVSLATIQGWPARLQEKLFERAQKMNALDKQAEEREKND